MSPRKRNAVELRILILTLALIVLVIPAWGSPLRDAVIYGDYDRVQKLVPGPSPDIVNEKDQDGLTPLHWVVVYLERWYSRENERTVDKIVKHLARVGGADVNARNKFGQTPLHYAAAIGLDGLVLRLIGLGADINAKDVNSVTPLHCIVRNDPGRFSPVASYHAFYWKRTIKFLLQWGADVHAKDSRGLTPLHYLMSSRAGTKEDMRVVVDYLLSKGADINARGDDGSTPLHLTVTAFGNNDFIPILVDKGSDINARDNWGRTPLHDAAAFSHKYDIRALLGRGGDPTIKDNDGNTALVLAKQRRPKTKEGQKTRKEVIEMLESAETTVK